MKDENQKQPDTDGNSATVAGYKELTDTFITVIDDREVKLNYQLEFSYALGTIRAYQQFIDDLFDGYSPKHIRENFHDIDKHNKQARKFLKKYYWKDA